MEKDLTPRQWKLYQFLKESNYDCKQEKLLSNYEEWLRNEYLKTNERKLTVEQYRNKYGYGYVKEIINRDIEGRSIEFVNLTSGREFRKDLQALRNHPTIQKIITSKGIANNVEEAEKYLKNKQIKILKMLKEYHIEHKKLEKHLQTRLQFKQERDFIEAVREFANE